MHSCNLVSVASKNDSPEPYQTTRDFFSSPTKVALLGQQNPVCLRNTPIPCLTSTLPRTDCRASVVIPVRNEAENLPTVIQALANQVDSKGDLLDPNNYEILLLANNCTDNTVEVIRRSAARYPLLQMQAIQVCIPKEVAHVGKARQMVMDEAYRRLSMIGRQGRIIASTDGDTHVASNWISAFLNEFDQDVDAVGGRIITTQSRAADIDSKVSLYYLRRIAHAYITAQIECFLDPQTHDCWPRHHQYYGANMAISAEMYGHIGGLPLVKDEEDVALYRQLKLADAKVRHSPDVRVFTSARQTGRATGGLAELLGTLSRATQKGQTMLVESPKVTESRILIRKHLRQVWSALQDNHGFNVKNYARTTDLIANSLGLPSSRLQQCLENASTFGWLVNAISDYQSIHIDPHWLQPTTEISIANMHLRQRLQTIRRSSQSILDSRGLIDTNLATILEALQQVQTIPLFSPTY